MPKASILQCCIKVLLWGRSIRVVRSTIKRACPAMVLGAGVLANVAQVKGQAAEPHRPPTTRRKRNSSNGRGCVLTSATPEPPTTTSTSTCCGCNQSPRPGKAATISQTGRFAAYLHLSHVLQRCASKCASKASALSDVAAGVRGRDFGRPLARPIGRRARCRGPRGSIAARFRFNCDLAGKWSPSTTHTKHP